VLKEKLLISLLSKGAISVGDIDEMPIPDRKVYLTMLRQMVEERNKAREEATAKRRLPGMDRYS
jgi:hypothetical protein